jgi:hypothetical protein
MWLIEVPDISVTLCSALLGEDRDSKNEPRGTLVAAMMASQAAFVIEHPEKSKDDVAVYLAGMEGVLSAYSAMKSKDPQLHLAQLDDLLVEREQGKLADYVKKTAKKCKTQK